MTEIIELGKKFMWNIFYPELAVLFLTAIRGKRSFFKKTFPGKSFFAYNNSRDLLSFGGDNFGQIKLLSCREHEAKICSQENLFL